MKKITFFICAFLFYFQLFAQSEKSSIDTLSTKRSTQDYFNKITFNIGGGIFIPQGELKRYFGTAPVLELNLNFPINKTKSLDLVGQIIIPNQVEDFTFIRTIDTVNAKSKMMFNFFAKFNKTLKQTSKGTLKAYLGVGVSTITTDARNPFYSGAENENKYEFISALLIAPGIDYIFKMGEHSKLAIGFNYQYAPYKLEGGLREDIGSAAIVPRVAFTF